MSASLKLTKVGRKRSRAEEVRSPANTPSSIACHQRSTTRPNGARGLVTLTSESLDTTNSARNLLGIQRFW